MSTIGVLSDDIYILSSITVNPELIALESNRCCYYYLNIHTYIAFSVFIIEPIHPSILYLTIG